MVSIHSSLAKGLAKVSLRDLAEMTAIALTAPTPRFRATGRKLREAMITRSLERNLPKWRILEIYLNVIEWGDGIYGAEAAARAYFNTSAASLTPSQAAYLAAMIPNPRTVYNPKSNPRNVRRRQRAIARGMRGISLPRRP